MNEDVMMRFDVAGSQLRLWAWRADGEMPTEPVLAAMDDKATVGYVSVFGVALDSATFSGAFRSVEVVSIPEPSAAALGIVGVASLVGWRRLRNSLRKLP